MLAPQCGLMHNVTSAMSLQVQHVVALLHHSKYSLTVCVCLSTSVTKSDFLYMMCSWQMKVVLIMTLMNSSHRANMLHWFSVFAPHQCNVYVSSAYVTPLAVC